MTDTTESRPADPEADTQVEPIPPPLPDGPGPAKSKADPVYAIVMFVMAIVSAGGLPSKLHLTTAMLMAIGGAIIAVAGVGRATYDVVKLGRKIALQDKIAVAIGAIAALLVAFGVPVGELDPDITMTVATAIASGIALHRASASKTATS